MVWIFKNISKVLQNERNGLMHFDFDDFKMSICYLAILSSFDNIFFTMSCFSSLKDHFKSKKFDINEEVITLFMTSFSNVVDPQNVFKIYDLIIITDNMGIFVLFALAVVYYLKDAS